MSQIAIRLRTAREKAGFPTATDAANRFGWKPPTYLGHENGTRGIRVEAAREYAKAFKINPDWLLFGTGPEMRGPSPDPTTTYDFKEDAEPFEHSTTGKSPIRSLFPGAKNPEVAFRATRHIPELSVCEGDLIVCDLGATGTSGQLVIVQHIDKETGETLGHSVRRYLPPHLLATGNGLSVEIIPDDSLDVVIRFPVAGFIRHS